MFKQRFINSSASKSNTRLQNSEYDIVPYLVRELPTYLLLEECVYHGPEERIFREADPCVVHGYKIKPEQRVPVQELASFPLVEHGADMVLDHLLLELEEHLFDNAKLL